MEKADMSKSFHPAFEYRIISAARVHDAADQPACNGALVLLWALRIGGQALR